MFDVLGIGIAAVDHVVLVPEFPPPEGKVRIRGSLRSCGGLSATALVAAARLGMRAAYAGVLGLDDDSDFVLRALHEEGVDTAGVIRLPEAGPGRSIVAVDGEGRRIVFSDPSGTLAGSDVYAPADLVREARVLLVDHVRVAASLEAARLARDAGIAVVADFERDEHPLFGQLLECVDHLVVPRSFGEHLTGQTDPPSILRSLRAPGRTVVLTEGSEGADFVGPEPDDRPAHRPAFAVPVVDTTGCGDAFHGAYAAGLVAGLDLSARVRLASAVAALTATRLGAQAGLPRRTDVEAFLAARS